MKSMASVLTLVENLMAAEGTYNKYILDTSILTKNLPFKIPKSTIDAIALELGGKKLGVKSTDYAFDKPYGPEQMLRRIIADAKKNNDVSTNDALSAGKLGISTGQAQMVPARQRHLALASATRSAVTMADGKENKELTKILSTINKYVENELYTLEHTVRKRIVNSQGKYEYVFKTITKSDIPAPSAQDTKFLVNRMREALKDYASADAIDSLKEYVNKAALAAFGNKALPKQITVVNKKGQARRKIVKYRPKISVASNNTIRQDKGQFASLPRMLGYINSIVHSYVRRNMGLTAGKVLRYRTGRFSNSVKVLGLAATKSQAVNLTYTYMLSPYQTFEPKFAKGYLGLDPRTLIDKSIRMLMREAFTSSGTLVTTTRI